MTSRPIVFIHRGQSDLVEMALQQAAASNPHGPIFIIADVEYRVDAPVQWIPLQSFMGLAEQFRPLYKHVTFDEFEYNLFCIQRWFVLLEFATRHGFERLFYADSDVMIYSDLHEALTPFEECDMAFSQCHCGHNTVINSVEALQALCSHSVKVFSSPLEEVTRFKEELRLEQAGVSGLVIPLNDMRLLHTFWTLRKYLIGDTSLIRDGTTFDHNINYAETGYAMDGQVKAVRWQGTTPYVRHERLGKEVRFHTLHFQAGAKELIRQSLRV